MMEEKKQELHSLRVTAKYSLDPAPPANGVKRASLNVVTACNVGELSS